MLVTVEKDYTPKQKYNKEKMKQRYISMILMLTNQKLAKS